VRDRLRRLQAHRLADPLLAGTLAVTTVASQLRSSDAEHTALAVVLLGALAAPVAWRRKRPLAALLAFTGLLLLARGEFAGRDLPPLGPGLLALFLCFAVGAETTPRQGVPAVLAVVGALQIVEDFTDAPNVEILFFTLAPWWAGREVGRRRTLVAMLLRRERELEAAEDEFTQLSVRRERARIAVELHDVVSHHVAVMVIQAGAGRLARADAGADGAAARFATIGDAGRLALDDMDRLVDVLGATSGACGTPGIELMVQHARDAGIDVRLELPPESTTIDADTLTLAHRIVQEGLTNVFKHAPGTTVSVTMTDVGGELLVEMRDDGRGAAAHPALARTGSGLGLLGMRERVEGAGGRLEAGPALGGGGWRLAAWLPSPR